jgi:nucleotide-binding universal stress UspA family protein
MHEENEGGSMKRILVPTDFSEASLKAVRYAVELTSAVRGRMLLLHVVEGNPVRIYSTGEFPERLAHFCDLRLDTLCHEVPRIILRRDLDEEACWKLAALLPPGAPERVRTWVTVGRVTAEIFRVAREEKADLIVLGTDGRRGLHRLLRRSIAAKVIRKTPIPVVIFESQHPRLRRASGSRSIVHRRLDRRGIIIHPDDVVALLEDEDIDRRTAIGVGERASAAAGVSANNGGGHRSQRGRRPLVGATSASEVRRRRED